VAEEKLGARTNGEYLHEGVQNFTPTPGLYRVIWVQWVGLYLTDEDMIDFLHRCKDGLSKGGCIFFKENVTTNSFVLDTEDNSITRTDSSYKRLFRDAGMSLLLDRKQEDFPSELFDVKMYALR